MNKGMQRVVLNLFAEVLSLTASEEERMKQVEEFDRVFGVSISDWEEEMKKYTHLDLRTGLKDLLAKQV